MRNLVASFHRLPRDVQMYGWAWFLIGFGYFGIFSVLFNLYLSRLGLGTETIGLITGAALFAWGVGAIPAGMIGTRIGNRQAMNLGVAIIVIGLFLLLCAGFLPAQWQVGWITTWWVVIWLANALNIVNAAPWIMEVAAPEQRGEAFTAQLVLQSLGGFIGSILAGILPTMVAKVIGVDADSATAYLVVLWLAPIAFAGANYLLLRTQPRAPVKVEIASSHTARMPYLVLGFVMVVVFLQIGGEGLVRPFFNLYLDAQLAVPLTQIGILIGLAQVLPILSTLVTPWVLSRWGAGRALIAIGLAYAVCLLVMTFIVTWLGASLGYIAFMSIVSIASVVRTLFSLEIVEAQWRTVVSMATTIAIALGQALFAAWGGFLIASYGYGALFFSGAVMALACSCIVWAYLRMGGRVRAPEAKSVASA